MRWTFWSGVMVAVAIGLLGCSKEEEEDSGRRRQSEGGDSKNSSSGGGGSNNSGGSSSTAASSTSGGPTFSQAAYVTARTFAALYVRPQRISQSPLLKGLPQDKVLAQPKEELGVDLRDIEEVSVLFSSSLPGETLPDKDIPFTPTVLVRFSKAPDQKKLLSTMTDAKQVTLQGKTVHVSERGGAAHFVDDRTLLITFEKNMEQVIGNPAPAGPLLDRLNASDRSGDMSAVALVEPILKIINTLPAEERKQIPPPVALFLTTAAGWNAASVAIDLQGATLLKVTVDAKTKEAADPLEQMGNGLLASVKEGWPKQKEMALKQVPPDLAQSVGAVVDQLLAGVAITRGPNPERVELTVQKPADLQKLVDQATPMIGDMLSQPRPGPSSGFDPSAFPSEDSTDPDFGSGAKGDFEFPTEDPPGAPTDDDFGAPADEELEEAPVDE